MRLVLYVCIKLHEQTFFAHGYMAAVSGRVEDMMKRSFAETDSAKHEVDRKQALTDLQGEISDIQGRESCPVCDVDIAQYYSSCASISTLDSQMKV